MDVFFEKLKCSKLYSIYEVLCKEMYTYMVSVAYDIKD